MNEIDITLKKLTHFLLDHHKKISCAESCTGGLISSYLTKLSGSSNWFEMGFVTYSNVAKINILQVKEETLKEHGAVSENTVLEMAQGALSKSGADYALSVSGIAGPEGGTPDKPVGTIWFGFASKERSIAKLEFFSGDRASIRLQCVDFALNLAVKNL